MIRSYFFILMICLMIATQSCVSPVKELYPPSKEQPIVTVFAINHGWHTGIILDQKQARPFLPALESDFEWADYLEIGWGDEGFYQANEITSGLTMQAIFWPTDSVMHIVALDEHPRQYFIGGEIIEISLSEAGFKKMVESINESFFLDESHQHLKLKKGIYGTSWFYRANGSYHLFNTCNIWTANMFRAAGFPISTFYASTAGNVMYQLNSYKIEPQAVNSP